MSQNKEQLYIFILAALQFAHIVDFVILMPLGPTLMRELSISPIEFASLVSSYNFSAAAGSLIFSLIADRFNRKTSLNIVFTGFIIGTLACALSSNFSTLLTARIIAGSFGGILNAIVFAIVGDLIPYSRRGKALSVIMSSFSIASVLGVPLGLTLADYFGWKSAFLFIVAFSIIILILTIIIIPNMSDYVKKTPIIKTFQQFGKVLSFKDHLIGYALIFSISLSAFSLIPFISPFAVKNLGVLESQLKYIYLVGGFFTVITARIFGILTDKYGALKVFFILAIISMLPILAYTHATKMPFFLFLTLTTAFMTIVSGRFIPCMTMVTAIPSNEYRGGFMALQNSIRSLGSATATLVGGAIIYESEITGKIMNYEKVGFFACLLTIVAILVAIKVYAIINNNTHEKYN